MEIKSKELTEYITDIRKSIEAAHTDSFDLVSDVEFELAIVNRKEKEGGFSIFVVDAKGKYENQSVSKIKFKMGFRPPSMTR